MRFISKICQSFEIQHVHAALICFLTGTEKEAFDFWRNVASIERNLWAVDIFINQSIVYGLSTLSQKSMPVCEHGIVK